MGATATLLSRCEVGAATPLSLEGEGRGEGACSARSALPQPFYRWGASIAVEPTPDAQAKPGALRHRDCRDGFDTLARHGASSP